MQLAVMDGNEFFEFLMTQPRPTKIFAALSQAEKEKLKDKIIQRAEQYLSDYSPLKLEAIIVVGRKGK